MSKRRPSSPRTTSPEAIDGSANVIIAAINQILHRAPAGPA
jgi:hypothetical protein